MKLILLIILSSWTLLTAQPNFKIVDGDKVKVTCKCIEGRVRYDSMCVNKDYIDIHIPKIERRLISTRKELNNYRTKLPELVKSLEEWGDVPRKARNEAFLKAAIKGGKSS